MTSQAELADKSTTRPSSHAARSTKAAACCSRVVPRCLRSSSMCQGRARHTGNLSATRLRILSSCSTSGDPAANRLLHPSPASAAVADSNTMVLGTVDICGSTRCFNAPKNRRKLDFKVETNSQMGLLFCNAPATIDSQPAPTGFHGGTFLETRAGTTETGRHLRFAERDWPCGGCRGSSAQRHTA